MRPDQPHRIQFACSGDAPDVMHRWPEMVGATWPGRVGPRFDHVPLGKMEEFLGSVTDALGAACARPHAVLLVLSPLETSASIDRLIGSLHEAQLPAVILLRDAADWGAIQQHGVIVRSWESSPETVAAMLFALAERQSAVEMMAREASVAQRCSGGIRVEMDRMHEELHLAAAIQREFTSAPLPMVDRLELAVLFRPVNFVSGDIYCVRELHDGSIAFLLADAVGHGVPAALLTMVLASSMAMTRRGPDGVPIPLAPSQVLSALNRRLCESCFGSGRFVTAVYGVIDPRTRHVTLAGAGHPHPVHLGAHGASSIKTEGPLLGIFAEAEFDEASFQLGQDDTLVVYTDGMDAAFPHAGPKRRQKPDPAGDFAGALAGIGPNPGECLERLAAVLDAQAGSLNQADDVTVLCIAPARRIAEMRVAA
jgi:sigma-B regulation protein RsbU (phosphoserine phosphatase)